MKYRSSCKDYFYALNSSIKDKDIDPGGVMDYVKKYIYLDDMHQYAIALFPGKEVSQGYGNILSKVVIMLDKIEVKYIELLKSILGKINIDFNDVYIMPYIRTEDVSEDALSKYKDLSDRELACMKPKIILSLGDSIDITPINGATIKTVDSATLNVILDEDGDKTPEEIRDAKAELWANLKHIIRHYTRLGN